MTIAVIFVPAAHVAIYAAQCLDYCAARGYEVAGVVAGDWAAAAGMLIGRTANIIVVARPDHLAPDREPRIEVADALPPADAADDPDRRRRPRLI